MTTPGYCARLKGMPKVFCALCLVLWFAWPAEWVLAGEETLPKVGAHSLRILSSNVLELMTITTKDPDPARVTSWNLVDSNYLLQTPAAQNFLVTVDGQPVAIQAVLGFKRRPLYAPFAQRDLRIENSLYLKISRSILDNQTVEVKNPAATLWGTNDQYLAISDPLRYSPAIHVNQEGYLPALPKKAVVGYYLGNAGELNVSSSAGFKLIDANTGLSVYQGSLAWKPDRGYEYTPTPYQKVFVADFSSFTNPGVYRIMIPWMGASLPFSIGSGVAMSFTRAYALGLYHQRCGTGNSFPFTRFTHGACHINKADIPSPQSSFVFTWDTIAGYSSDYASNPRHTAPQLKNEGSQLYPLMNLGKLDVSGGHHDAGDYSKYTINSAGFIHYLMFAVDAFPGVASLDNLGIPESGDGISDLMQEAKWEADFLAKMQDADGGFYFLVYPRSREYESDVLPDKGDAQVVWPKTTAATAAAVGALAQTASSPRFKQQYPVTAALYMQKAQLGWNFLTNAIARYSKDGSYQKITSYGDEFMHDDELAWAACEMYLATGNPACQQKLLEWFPDPDDPATWRWGWWRLWDSYGKAIRSYAFGARTGRLAANQLDPSYLAKCLNEINLGAQDHLTRAHANAYGTSFPLESKQYRVAGWYFSSERAFDITVAYQLNARADFLEAILSNLNYEAGCNPMNVCFVTGLGVRRQREIVHQYAQNDRRISPPSGLPLGNIQSGFDSSDSYQSELAALCFPQEDTVSAPFPFYDRWADAFDLDTEFTILDQARSVGNLAFLSTFTSTKTQSWVAVPAQIVLPNESSSHFPVTATLNAPGLDLTGTRIVWEAQGQEPAFGANYSFVPSSNGTYWVEAEAQWADGRRVFAAASFLATNRPPTISVVAEDLSASRIGPEPGVFSLVRVGNTNLTISVNYLLGGTALNGVDYHISPAGSSSSLTLAAGVSSTKLTILPVANTNTTPAKTVILALSANPSYLVGVSNRATINIVGNSGPITSIRMSNGTSSLVWASVPGKVYQVLFKNSLAAANWSALTTNITATNSLTPWVDTTAGSVRQRFYRISQVSP